MNELELVINEVKKAVVGKDEHIKKILACILARGHVLLEDIPGCLLYTSPSPRD